MISFDKHKAQWAQKLLAVIPWETPKFRADVLENILAQFSAGRSEQSVEAEFETIKLMFDCASSFYDSRITPDLRAKEHSKLPFEASEIQEPFMLSPEQVQAKVVELNNYLKKDPDVTRKIAGLRLTFLLVKEAGKSALGEFGVALQEEALKFFDMAKIRYRQQKN